MTEAPWNVAIWIRNSTSGESTHHCGGSIFKDNYVLTAAHCLDPRIRPQFSDDNSVKSDLTIIVGMENPGLNCTHKKDVEHKIKDFFIHPNFDFPYFDVAIIELETKIKFSRGIASVCLPSASTDTDEGDAVSLTGWGARVGGGLPSKVLTGTSNLKVTSDIFCKYRIGDLTFGEPLVASVFNRTSWLKKNIDNEEKSTEGLLCVKDLEPNGTTGSCPGDSGSPVVKEKKGMIRLTYEQVGIVSGGRCNDRSTPSVLTHVGHESVLKFIYNITCNCDNEGSKTDICDGQGKCTCKTI